jgi:hypothetical protein
MRVHPYLGLGFVFLAACGSQGVDQAEGPDAAALPPPPAAPAARRDPWEIVRTTSALRARLGEPRAIARVSERFEPAAAKPKAGWQPLGGAPKVSFPPTATGAMRIGASDDVWIELTPEDVTAVPGDATQGALVYRGVQRDVDAVHVATGERVEELRVFHAPRGEVRASWRIDRGPGVREVRVRDGLVEVVDTQGRVRLATEKAFAVDSAGERRDVEVAIASGRMSASVDARGMSGEVVLDPSWVAVANMNNARSSSMVFQSLLDGRVLAAGGTGSNCPGAGGPPTNSAELYDSISKTWTTVGSMSTARQSAASVVLADGRVLVLDQASAARVGGN